MQTAVIITDTAVTKISNGVDLVKLVSRFNDAAWKTDPGRPPLAGNWHSMVLPRVHAGEDYLWRRVASQGTGNGGFWVPTKPISEEAKTAWWDYMAEMQTRMPAVNAWAWMRQPRAMETEALYWIGRIGPLEARYIAELPIPGSWKELRELEDRGWTMPRCKSIPRVASAMRALRASIV